MLVVVYYPASGKLGGTEGITAFTSYVPPMALKKQLLLRAPHAVIDIQHGTRGSIQELLLGTVRFKYKP